MRTALALLLFMALPAAAGPWLRDEGSTYLSFSAEITEPEERQAWLSLYAEHGLRPKLTIGLDAGGRHDGTNAKAIAFARLPLIGEGPLRVAAEIGLGATYVDEQVHPAVRPLLSFGYGLDLMEGAWVAADISSTRDLLDGETEIKLDAVMGLRPTERDLVTLGIRSSDGKGWRLVPGYDRSFGTGTVGVAAVLDPGGQSETALILRTVVEF